MNTTKRSRTPAAAPGKSPQQHSAAATAGDIRQSDLGQIDSSVKSARRVFDVLDFFEQHKMAASAIDIANALRFPQSSASALLRTMTAHGYLHYDSSRREYIPTPRVALLGHWLSPQLFAKGRLLNLMEDLASRTGETVMVGLRNGLSAQYIHVIQARLPMRLHVKAGTLRPLGRSGLGYALLSQYSDRDVRRIVRLLNSHELQPERTIDVKALLRELAKVREVGHAFSVNLVTPGAGVVAMNLPPMSGTPEPLAICVAGLTDALVAQETSLACLMKSMIAFHLVD